MNNNVVFALIVLGFLLAALVQYIYITEREFNKRQKENDKQRENNSRNESKES